MLRKAIGAALVLVLFVGIAFADEIRAVITKVDGDKVTFAPLEGKGKNAKKGDEKTLPTVNDVKVVRMKRNKETKKFEVGGDVKDGLQNKMFSTISEKGIGAFIVTDSDNKKITEIRVLGGGGKKKDKQ
jgi:hypothetical protein